MKLDSAMTPDLLIVRVREQRIDAAGAVDFKDRMRDLIAANGCRVMLDLSEVAFIDSSGLGAIVAVRRSLGPDRMLELTGLTASVAKVFRLTRMESVFTIHSDVPDLAGHHRDGM